jgi:hypothetical protein
LWRTQKSQVIGEFGSRLLNFTLQSVQVLGHVRPPLGGVASEEGDRLLLLD